MSEELKPCPFCGKQPSSRWFGSSESPDYGYWGIDCCYAMVHKDDKEEATSAWNARPSSAGEKEASLEQIKEIAERVGKEKGGTYREDLRLHYTKLYTWNTERGLSEATRILREAGFAVVAKAPSAGEKEHRPDCEADAGDMAGECTCDWLNSQNDKPSAGEKPGTEDIVGRLQYVADLFKHREIHGDLKDCDYCQTAARIEELEKALEPFAKLAETVEFNMRIMAPNERVYHEERGDRIASIRYCDLRRARTLKSP